MTGQYAIRRRVYLVLQERLKGASWLEAEEAVDRFAAEHPDWDLAERRPYHEWAALESV